jgi:hypothetical protein
MIPTLFKLGSECDKALLRTAAERVVEKKKDEIVSFLSGRERGLTPGSKPISSPLRSPPHQSSETLEEEQDFPKRVF